MFIYRCTVNGIKRSLVCVIIPSGLAHNILCLWKPVLVSVLNIVAQFVLFCFIYYIYIYIYIYNIIQ